MPTHPLISNATNPLSLRERARRRADGSSFAHRVEAARSNLTKRQIEVTMFAAGVGTLKGLKVGKLVEQSKDV